MDFEKQAKEKAAEAAAAREADKERVKAAGQKKAK